MNKKRNLVVVILFILISVTACGKENPQNGEVPSIDEPKITSNESEEKKEPEASNRVANLQETFELADWEVTLNSTEFSNKVEENMLSISADEGNKFLMLNLSVKNNGSDIAGFTSSFSDMEVSAVYDNNYNYKAAPTSLINDLTSASAGVNPLETKTSYLVIPVPVEVEESDKPLDIKFEYSGKDIVIINIR